MLTDLLSAALAGVSGPLLAQSMPMSMPGMAMPAHRAGKATDNKKPAAKKKAKAAHPAAHQRHQAPPITMDSRPSEIPAPMPPMDHSQMDHGAMVMPMPETAPAGPMGGMPMVPSHAHDAMTMEMGGALGPYPMTRESSGTAWQPDASEHMGLMHTSGDWTLMAHGLINLVYDDQSGPRGDDKLFISGMLMGMARRPMADGTLQLRAMVSPEPLMGPGGYPLLLASGETANGRKRLIDRQHPHDFFMELSASASQNIGGASSVFVYAGLPGEPAFGPPAFMHREAILDSPEAPISHHWLDSTHISFGVFTAGVALDRVKLEVSRFNGREPDQHRWNIETGPLDSTAVRLSWNPTDTLALQGSWGHFTDPEQLEPGVDQNRLSASALYARELGPGWKFAGTLAWGRKAIGHHKDDAYVAEASLKHDAWTLFGRGEVTENRELVAVDEHCSAFRVGKVSLGAVRDFRVADHLALGAGGLFTINFVPDPLKASYGGTNPAGLLGFVRLKLN